MTPPSPDKGLREAVARIIDPTAFEPMTGHIPRQRQKDALAKADAILALPVLSREGWRSCTCHPDDNPPSPCPQKYALSECQAAALSASPLPSGGLGS